MKQFVKKVKKIGGRHITDRHGSAQIYETREMVTMATRDMKMVSAVQHEGNFGSGTASRDIETLKTNK